MFHLVTGLQLNVELVTNVSLEVKQHGIFTYSRE